jgi:phosphatidylserine/phosphatidylglycerophosphate/cardiolipin synthase-like enzyme
MGPEPWFLTPSERGNPASALDRRHAEGRAWTDGNQVRVLIHGAMYFQRLYEELILLGPGDRVYFTDWEGDADECLAGPGTEVGKVLAELARGKSDVRGLLWRSHPRQAHFSEQANARLVREVNEAGGELLLDERVKSGGSHHQKLVLLRRCSGPDDDIAFIGGIDLARGRHDDARHEGDPQAVQLSPQYGKQPPWHDIHLEVRGPAVGDLAYTFRERWEDPAPLDHRNPLRAILRRVDREPRHPHPLPPEGEDPAPNGPHSIQVVRTYPAKYPRYPFAPAGERSVARAYQKALQRGRRLIYIEDQYLWSEHAARILAGALVTWPDLHLIVVVPRFAERGGKVASRGENIGQMKVLDLLMTAGAARVGVYDLENVDGTPIYVHAKICLIDDVWMQVGSDNLNRRSWTHDSEVSCVVLDSTIDEREPRDPGGLGDGARLLPRATRLNLWREHLGRAEGEDDDLLDGATGFQAWIEAARALDAWHAAGCAGPRPAGHVRVHHPQPMPQSARGWAGFLHDRYIDPDGRPRRLRKLDQF